jgi:hypothetical protein
MNEDMLVRQARAVLDFNWTGEYTMPGPRLYPHQWSWDSAGTDLRSLLLKLPAEQVVIRRFARELVPILRQHRRDTASAHQVPHAVHAWPLKARAALYGIYYLFEDLVPFTSGVLS